MGEAARVFGKGSSFEWRGQRYTLAPLDLDMLAAFEAWLEDNAFQRVERMRHRVTADVYARRLEEVTKLVASGAFRYNGPLADEASASPEGQKYLLLLRLARHHAEITADTVEQMWQEHYQAILARIEAMERDPNSPAPAATA